MAGSNAPTWVLHAAMQSVMGEPGAGAGDLGAGGGFVPAQRFTGARPGYVFKAGERGLG